MKKALIASLAVASAALFLLADPPSQTSSLELRAIDPPAASGSGMPYLSLSHQNRPLLSWLEPDSSDPKRHSLRYSEWNRQGWSKPTTAASGSNWFVNWADVPSVVAVADGSLLAHWLQRNPSQSRYGYGIRIARLDRMAFSWTNVYVSPDYGDDYTGFLSFARTNPGVGAAYLSPPHRNATAKASKGDHDNHDEDGQKSLAWLDLDAGRVAAKIELDPHVCSCCPTSTVATSKGLVTAYRDRSSDEIRDISVVRQVNGSWTKPMTVHADGWKINACPTDGPAMIANGNKVAIAWMTRANAQPKVQLSLSYNAGQTFSKPVRIDDGNPVGRPFLAWSGQDDIIVGWMEKTPTAAEIRIRRVTAGKQLHKGNVVANVENARSSGFPRIVAIDGRFLVAWRGGDKLQAAIVSNVPIGSR